MIKTLTLCFFLLFFGLSGCSRTIVHLHADKLTTAEQEAIRAELQAQGFIVERQHNEPPAYRNLILYTPHDGIDNDLSTIDTILAAHGFSADHRYTPPSKQLGKHEYTAGNIGVYLIPAGFQPYTTPALQVRNTFPITETDADFISTDCDKEYVYELFDDGRAIANDFSFPVGEAALATGRWQSNEESVTLNIEGKQFQYKKTRFHREYANEYSDHVISYYILLEPVGYYELPFGCTFKSTFSEAT